MAVRSAPRARSGTELDRVPSPRHDGRLLARPGATAAALQDGWLSTGDLARRDSEGYLCFAGRRKDVIVRGGSNISPQEVEAALYEHDGVGEVGVVGSGPDLGRTGGGLVSRAPRRSVGAEELIAFARGRLADYKTPEQIVFLDALPKNAIGKVARRPLREMLVAGEANGG